MEYHKQSANAEGYLKFMILSRLIRDIKLRNNTSLSSDNHPSSVNEFIQAR